jgi:hypothetical protein
MMSHSPVLEKTFVVKLAMNDTWIPWTEECKKIPYISKGAIGNGEYRVAYIFKTKPLGQNSPYDLDIQGLGQFDVKQLDTDNSFNTGVKLKNALMPIKYNIQLMLCREDSPEHIKTISSDEICQKNIKKIYNYFVELNEQTTALLNQKTCQIYHPETGQKIIVNPIQDYNAHKNMNNPVDENIKKFAEIYNHPYVVHPSKMMDDLKNLINLFDKIGLIFVSESKGYYIRTTTEIEFCRITKGSPRFKARFQASSPIEQKTNTEQHFQSVDT